MIKFEIKTKKSKSGKYGYYKCPKNITVDYRSYPYKIDGVHLLYTAILQYISDNLHNISKIDVSIYPNGEIAVYYMFNEKISTTTYYNINSFYLDSDKNILYKIENNSERLSMDRKLKLQEINNK